MSLTAQLPIIDSSGFQWRRNSWLDAARAGAVPAAVRVAMRELAIGVVVGLLAAIMVAGVLVHFWP
jgi:hypothetical protein